ncbi:hypothetical protein NQ314_000949 [Rhamnusium bicolor]|uniref:DDE Tnp4 domain-containing protein n=1 Tax=Rhamnusium bicolor TaxID=1586634 RepID=A0AAV8ZTJ7_9CUCU|nr:hypothetical protein NQ314_000949 [Rhamnusium bicolor]
MDEDNFDDFFDYLDHLEVIEAHRQRDRLFKRYIRDGENPLEFYEDVEFRKRYRFSKHVVTNVILPLILDGLQIGINNRGLPVSPLIKLLICLRFYATGNFQNVTGDLRKVSQATVSQTIKQVSVLLAEQLGNFIKFPDNENEQRINIIKFYAIAGFPSLLAGPRMEILDIVVRHPGSTHDSVILSAVRVRFEQGQIRGLLLRDNVYACRPYLLTPVIYPTTQQEENYNRAHKRTRNLIEMVNGLWKRRFPCLYRTLTIKVDTSVAVICATAVLHNIALQYGDNFQHDDVDLENVDVYENNENNILGLAYRRQFIIQHF